MSIRDTIRTRRTATTSSLTSAGRSAGTFAYGKLPYTVQRRLSGLPSSLAATFETWSDKMMVLDARIKANMVKNVIPTAKDATLLKGKPKAADNLNETRTATGYNVQSEEV